MPRDERTLGEGGDSLLSQLFQHLRNFSIYRDIPPWTANSIVILPDGSWPR